MGITYYFKRVAIAMETFFAQLLHAERRGIVSPKKIKNEVEISASRMAVDWGKGSVAYPNCYQLSLDSDSWDRYYGKRLSETQRHVKETVAGIIASAGGDPDQSIVVTLVPDESLRPCTVRVDASFVDVKVEVPSGDGTRPIRVESTPDPGPTMPNATNKVACLVSPTLPRPIKLKNGDTIGVPRYADTPLPTVQLPDKESTAGISHHHASFAMDVEGTWSITSQGRNGTVVKRDGISRRLDRGTPYALYSGDTIVLGESEDAAMTILIGRAANEEMDRGGRG